MTMKYSSNLLIAFALIISLFSCEKPDVGFFSYEGIEMREDTLEVVRGIYQISSIPYVDGSTRPITFELVQVRNLLTGEEVPEFLNQKYEISLWSTAYDGTTDTTMELVNEKLYTSYENPLQINSYMRTTYIQQRHSELIRRIIRR